MKQMTMKGYEVASNNNEGDLSIVIYEPENSEWVSIASDDFQFNTKADIKNTIEPISDIFHTDIIAASCNDSDYLMLNLLNTLDGTDGWINIGSLYVMKILRRTSIGKWKKKVNDYGKLKEVIKQKYVLAEEAFYKVAELLNMQPRQACLETNYLDDLEISRACKLSFVAPGMEKQLPELKVGLFGLTPCKIGESYCVFVNNRGGKSKGIGILFVGDYVENDDIVFENVTFESDYGSEKRKIVPITLEKVKLTNGKHGFYWEDKDFAIPPAVSRDIPEMKRMDLEFKKQFGVRFVPQGNPRKVLDIKVAIYPLENSRDGQAVWYVYRYSKTKEEYIKEHNMGWVENKLNPDDFDL